MVNCERVLIGLSDMPALFGVAQQTAWRWNTDKAGRGRLPAPDVRLGSVPYWLEETVRDWAETRTPKLSVHEPTMRDIRRNQLLG